jgi:hypothetical protein
LIGLFEAADVDVLGATVVTLVQLAYVPTLAIWGMAFVAGPGFAVGAGTAVSPAGTQLGVIPGLPALGALPETTTPWLLLLALLPVALGALAGWIARSRLVAAPISVAVEASPVGTEWDAAPDPARSSALSALLSGVDRPASEEREDPMTPPAQGDQDADPLGARAVIALGIAVLAAAGAALLSVVASGSLGPGRLAEVGPQPGPVALAVGGEVLLGAAILLLSPRRRSRPSRPAESDRDAAPAAPAEAQRDDPLAVPADVVHDDTLAAPAGQRADRGDAEQEFTEADTAPIALIPPSPRPTESDPDSTATADLGPRRPRPLPPID